MSTKPPLDWTKLKQEVMEAIRSYSESEYTKPPYIISTKVLAGYIMERKGEYPEVTSLGVTNRGVAVRCATAMDRMKWEKRVVGKYVIPWERVGGMT